MSASGDHGPAPSELCARTFTVYFVEPASAARLAKSVGSVTFDASPTLSCFAHAPVATTHSSISCLKMSSPCAAAGAQPRLTFASVNDATLGFPGTPGTELTVVKRAGIEYGPAPSALRAAYSKS